MMIQQHELWDVKENYRMKNKLERGVTLYRYVGEVIFAEMVNLSIEW